MTDSAKREPFTLKRWSQRKLAAAREPQSTAAPEPPPASAAVMPLAPSIAPASDAVAADAPASELPPIESLTIDSDFTAFMQPEISEELKRGALRKLFSDPRFNVMDGLDVYIDDYSKPDPISPDVVRQLMQARYIFNPPATRVTADGHVEDVPPGSDVDAIAAQQPQGGELPAPVATETLASASVPSEACEVSVAQPKPPLARDADPESQ